MESVWSVGHHDIESTDTRTRMATVDITDEPYLNVRRPHVPEQLPPT